MKKIICLMLTILLAFGTLPLTVSAVGANYNLSYQLNSDGSGYIVTGCTDDWGADVEIPATYKGKPVVEIGSNVMATERFSTLYIPESVKKINLGLHPYSSLASISVNSNNKYYSSANGVLFNKKKTELLMYPGEKADKSYTIPSSVTKIHSSAFEGAEFESIKIPSSVKTIESCAFAYAGKLKSVSLPDGIKTIPDECFYNCYSLSKVKLPSNLSKIEYFAFVNCGLKSISIPKSVTSIGKMAVGYTSYPDGDKKVPGFKIQGASGSVAQQYAKSNGFAFTVVKVPAKTTLKSIKNVSGGVTITWNKVSGADSYIVYRKSGKSNWKAIKTGVTSTSYTDKTAKSGTAYTYTVRAVNIAGKGGYDSKGLAIKYLAVPSLKIISSAKSGVTFKWNKVTGASGYYVYRKTGNGGWKRIATVKGNSKVSYLDKSAKKGATYTYTVRAYSGKTLSSYNTKGLKIKDKY